MNPITTPSKPQRGSKTTPRERQLLEQLRTPQSVKGLSALTGLTPKTLRARLSSLRKRGFVEWCWRHDGVYWERVQQPRLSLPPGRGKEIILEQLEGGPKTTAQLAEALAVSPSRVWQVLRQLLESGAVVRAGVVHRGGQGRPTASFRIP